MIFIGDVHGQFQIYKKITDTCSKSIQLGDMGIGFNLDHLFPEDINHRFIRGNHDDPDKCRQKKNYLGDYGYLEDEDIFYVGGGYSIDRAIRTEGINWWPDEELNYLSFDAALKLYKDVKPGVVVSHDCPDVSSLYAYLLNSYSYKSNRTISALSAFMYVHQPKYWLFGHHHQSFRDEIDGTNFIGLNILERFDLERKK